MLCMVHWLFGSFSSEHGVFLLFKVWPGTFEYDYISNIGLPLSNLVEFDRI